MKLTTEIIGKQVTLLCVVITAVLLGGCSSVGPGFKNHPVDCGVGIPLADCLPGTAGYANGGGDVHRKEQTRQQSAVTDQFAAIKAQCHDDFQTPELDPIRRKVELHRDSSDAAPPFEIAANDTFPTEAERAVIAKWATLCEGCIKRYDAVTRIPSSATPLQVVFLQKVRAFNKEAIARVSDLMVSLYQQKLTYGEFAKKRYEITRDATAAERQFRESTLIADHERQTQAQLVAQQQFQNNMAAWSNYMQSVSARQPQTVHLNGSVRMETNCTSQRLGNVVSTNCN